MNKIKFVQLAVNKDAFRKDQLYAWREEDKVVATDGHRLHFAEDLPRTDKPFSLGDPGKETFLNWHQVIPNNLVSKVNIIVNKAYLNYFNPLVKLAHLVWGYEKTVEIKCEGSFLSFHLTSRDLRYSISLEIGNSNNETFISALNISYFADVYKAACQFNASAIEVQFFGDTLPLLFKIEGLGTAIIMPQKKHS